MAGFGPKTLNYDELEKENVAPESIIQFLEFLPMDHWPRARMLSSQLRIWGGCGTGHVAAPLSLSLRVLLGDLFPGHGQCPRALPVFPLGPSLSTAVPKSKSAAGETVSFLCVDFELGRFGSENAKS